MADGKGKALVNRKQRDDLLFFPNQAKKKPFLLARKERKERESDSQTNKRRLRETEEEGGERKGRVTYRRFALRKASFSFSSCNSSGVFEIKL